jgi:ABC-2 type transport system ATP-binding protein
MPSAIPALEAIAVTKRYGHVAAVSEVTLAIPSGSITALIGPNGAGKSTLIRAWTAFDRPSSGHVTVLGIDPWRDRSGALLALGYIPQSATIYRELSVDDHLDLAKHFRPRFDHAFAAGRLEELKIPLGQLGGTLSAGQQAQVALALALGARASVLLLDEPLASLDPLARREFLHVLKREVRDSGITALLSSHVVSDIEQVCDRLVVLGAGRLLLDRSLVDALASHRILEGDEPGSSGRIVDSFVGVEAETRLTLLECSRPDAPGRAPTVEELVLGYLASGRHAGADLDRATN